MARITRITGGLAGMLRDGFARWSTGMVDIFRGGLDPTYRLNAAWLGGTQRNRNDAMRWFNNAMSAADVFLSDPNGPLRDQMPVDPGIPSDYAYRYYVRYTWMEDGEVKGYELAVNSSQRLTLAQLEEKAAQLTHQAILGHKSDDVKQALGREAGQWDVLLAARRTR